jgi:hypothetical protein
LAELLHWLMITGSWAVLVEASTVHLTRLAPPPPFADPLHCVTVALVVLPFGEHTRVGCVPPPPADPMHWLTVAGPAVATPVRMLCTVTEQSTFAPPPLTESLHWLTVPTTSWKVDGVVVQVGFGWFAGPWHSVATTTELPMPVATSSVLVTSTSQVMSSPGVL